jgi:hypothetical protein
MAHGDSAQQDATDIVGPTGPTQRLQPDQINYVSIGPAHFGMVISSPYDDGRRVLWSNGGDRIVKLDHDTFEVLATYVLPDRRFFTEQEAEEAIAKMETLHGQEAAVGYSLALVASILSDLAGVYALLDRDHNFYVGSTTGITVYSDAEEGNPDSGIIVKRTWAPPDEVTGSFVGMNMTYDGWLILVTQHGYVVALSRDFSEYHTVQMRHSENAKEHSEAVAEGGDIGYGWVRNGYAIDDEGGIYIVSNDHMHRVVWTGERLSVDEEDGAWAEPYRNGRGAGSGANPSLMGFGDEDKFVVITDADYLMNVTLFWRDEIPEDWGQLPGAPSRRIAGFLPANMGDPSRTAIQSEQSVVVAGYGAFVVNNEPASVPKGFPERATTILSAYLGSDPTYQPYGIQKFLWDPEARELKEAWANQEISAPNGVPYVSLGSNIVYFVGARDEQWTLEGVDWDTGEPLFHYVVGGARYNSFFSGVYLDQEGRVIYGTPWGMVRLEP